MNPDYRQNTKNRLAELIGEYFSDDEMCPYFYEDLRGEILKWKTYHENQLNNCSKVLKQIDGEEKDFGVYPNYLYEDYDL